MIRALVTGASGMLGSHLVERLLKAQVKVRAYARPTSNTQFLESLAVDIVKPGSAVPAAIRQAVEGCDCVFHLASNLDVGSAFRSGEGLERYKEADLYLTEGLLRASREEGVRRFIYVSSVSVYSVNTAAPIAESAPLDPVSDYGRSKVLAEGRVLAYQEQGLPTVIIRPCIAYGPRDRHFLPAALRLARLPILPLIEGGGHLIDLVYASDVAELIWSASQSQAAAGKIYNAASGAPCSVREMLKVYRELAGRSPRVFAVSPQSFARFARLTRGFWGNIAPGLDSLLSPLGVSYMSRDVYYDIAHARSDLFFAPQVKLKEGLALSLAYPRVSCLP